MTRSWASWWQSAPQHSALSGVSTPRYLPREAKPAPAGCWFHCPCPCSPSTAEHPRDLLSTAAPRGLCSGPAGTASFLLSRPEGCRKAHSPDKSSTYSELKLVWNEISYYFFFFWMHFFLQHTTPTHQVHWLTQQRQTSSSRLSQNQ